MKKTLLLMAMVVALAMSALAPAMAKGGPHDRATGDVTWVAQGGAGATLHTTFNAHDGAPGSQPDRGTWISTIGDSTMTISLDCVNVSGNEARMTGTVTEVVGDRWTVGDPYVVWVKDNATPSSDSGALVYDIGQAPNPGGADCYESQFNGLGSVSDGNLKVHSSTE